MDPGLLAGLVLAPCLLVGSFGGAVVFFVGMMKLLVRASGWHRLVAHHGDALDITATGRAVPLALVGGVRFKTLLRVAPDARGVRFSLLLPGIAPAFSVPWTALELQAYQGTWERRVKLALTETGQVIDLPLSTGELLAERSQGALVLEG